MLPKPKKKGKRGRRKIRVITAKNENLPNTALVAIISSYTSGSTPAIIKKQVPSALVIFQKNLNSLTFAIQKHQSSLNLNNENRKARPNWFRDYIASYSQLLSTLRDRYFRNLKSATIKKNSVVFYLRSCLLHMKPYFTFCDLTGHVYMTWSTGLFIKFFTSAKATKKSKLMRYLTLKFLRKTLIILRLRQVCFFFKNNPTFINELRLALKQKIAHKFFNPLTSSVVDEEKNSQLFLTTPYYIFYKTTSYAKQRDARCGRVKRKIRRRLVSANRLVD